MIARGAIHWVDLGQPVSSAPAKRRPAVVIQDDRLNRSGLSTVVVALLTSNTAAAEFPGNVFLPRSATGLTKDSVLNVTQVVTRDKADLGEPIGEVPSYLMDEVEAGLRLVLHL